MEQLKKIGDLCRQHYEKLIMIFALLLLAAAVIYLYGASQEETQKIQQTPRDFQKRPGKSVVPANLAPFEQTLKQATNPPLLNYSEKHNLFNPVKWQQPVGGGSPIKILTGKESGVEALQIVRIVPLILTVAYDRVATSGTAPDLNITGYHTVVTNELAPVNQPRARRIPQFVQPNSTNTQVFVVTEIRGPPEAPTEIIATLKDYNNERISFAPGKPYVRTAGYEAELKYPLTGKNSRSLRTGSVVEVEGESYKVVDITPNRVVLSDDSNGKRYAIQQFAPP